MNRNFTTAIATTFCLGSASTFVVSARSDAPAPVTIVVGGRAVPFVVSPYVGDDGQVYSPVDVVKLLGGTYEPNADGKTVTISGANGASTTVAYTLVSQRFCVPIQQLGGILGASETYDAASHTLTLRARLLMVRQESDSLNIYTSYPVYFHVERIADPSRLYVDLYGVDLGTGPAQIPTTNPQVTQIRTGHMDFNIARVVIDLRRDVAFRIDASTETNHVRVALGAAASEPVPVAPVTPPVVVAAAPPQTTLPTLPVQPATPPPPPASQGPLRITSMAVNAVSDTVTQVVIKASGTTKYRTVALTDPNRLAIDLAGADLQAGLQDIGGGNSDVVRAVRAGIVHMANGQFGRVVIDLAKIADYTVTTQIGSDGVTYLVSLETNSASNVPSSPALHGKIVMVDPGHGGSDSGAIGLNGIQEKNITLLIAKRLYNILLQNGATVYMTRVGDTLPSVDSRPQMAIAANADYFISIHCDETAPANGHSGTTVYYHARNPICQRMASDISRRVGLVSGIPALGTKSDYIRFPGLGFGVLRGSPMPAVLVETGYINDAADLAKLLDPADQENIAEGIAAGLIDFITERGGE